MIDTPSDIQRLAGLSYGRIQKILVELPPEQRQVVWAAVTMIKARKSPGDFAEIASGGWWKFAPHLRLINDVLLDACNGNKFICVSVSVRCGKSELGSKFMPAWYLCNNPNNKIILASYSKDLSRGFSKASRDIIKEFGPTLFDVNLSEDSAAADEFYLENPNRGGLKSTSVGASVIGFGGDLIILDDLYKGIDQAFNAKYNHDLQEWYKATLHGRLHPNASIVSILARWANDDFTGWLKEQSREVAGFDDWQEIKLSMRCDDEENDPLGRKIGESIWPDRFTPEWMATKESVVGPLYWASQYQQKPITIEGSQFDPSDWKYVNHVPHLVTIVRQWDLSAGGKRSDYVAGALMGIDSDKNIYVLDMVQQKCEFASEVEQLVRSVCVTDRIRYPNCLFAIEKTAGAGKAVIEHYENNILYDFQVISRPTHGDKEANAAPFAAKQQNHQVYIVRQEDIDESYSNPPWHDAMVTECAMFPNFTNDDQVDALSQGFKTLFENMTRRSRIRFRSFG